MISLVWDEAMTLQHGLICLQWISSCEGFTVNVTAYYRSLIAVNAVTVTNCTIFGQSAPSVFQLCVLSPFIVCVLMPSGFHQWLPTQVSVCLAFRQQPASVRQQRWNHCAQRHQAWKQVRSLTLDLLALSFSSSRPLRIAFFTATSTEHSDIYIYINSDIIPVWGTKTVPLADRLHIFQCWKLSSDF